MKKLYTAKNINVDIYQVSGVRQFELFLCKFAQPKSIILTSYGFKTQKQSSSKKKCFDIDHFFIDLIIDIKFSNDKINFIKNKLISNPYKDKVAINRAIES